MAGRIRRALVRHGGGLLLGGRRRGGAAALGGLEGPNGLHGDLGHGLFAFRSGAKINREKVLKELLRS